MNAPDTQHIVYTNMEWNPLILALEARQCSLTEANLGRDPRQKASVACKTGAESRMIILDEYETDEPHLETTDPDGAR